MRSDDLTTGQRETLLHSEAALRAEADELMASGLRDVLASYGTARGWWLPDAFDGLA
jgi:hypothetical protein